MPNMKRAMSVLKKPVGPMWHWVRSAGFSVLLAGGGVAGAHAAEVRLRILETTDIHMNLLSYDYYQDKPTDQYGLARTITLIKAARAEVNNSVLFDNGDLLQGNPLGDYVAKVKPLKVGEVHPAYRVMNQLGYDAANIGNHEFNYGLDYLRRSLEGAAFPYVNANIYLADKAKESANPTHAFTPYVLLDRKLVDAAGTTHMLKIGVIGFAPPQILMWDKSHLEGKVVVRDVVETARKYVPLMRAQGAQIVVAIPHAGFEKGPVAQFGENTVAPLAEVPGVDAILLATPMPNSQARPLQSTLKWTLPRGPSMAWLPLCPDVGAITLG